MTTIIFFGIIYYLVWLKRKININIKLAANHLIITIIVNDIENIRKKVFQINYMLQLR